MQPNEIVKKIMLMKRIKSQERERERWEIVFSV